LRKSKNQPPSDPATEAQTNSIYHNLSTFIDPNSPKGRKVIAMV
jgi:hypothetical protein